MQLSRTRKRLILMVSCVEAFMATLDGSIVNIALPNISAQMHISISAVQWVSTAYLLAISLLLLVWGKLADLYGKKKIVITGFLLFSLGSALCAFSGSLSMLVFSRVVQAVGAGAMMSLSQGIVTSTFEPGERGAALGQVGMLVALGSLAGPSLGGVLVRAFGWPSIFVINIPIAIGAAVLAYCVLPPEKKEPARAPFDRLGTGLFSAFLLVFFLTLLLVQQGSIPVWVLLPAVAVAAGALAGFLRAEKRAADPLVHLELFRLPVFSIGLAQGFLIFIALSASLMFVPFYLQDYLRYNALHAGLVVSVYPLVMAVTSPLSGRLADRTSTRPLTVAGTALSSVGLIILAAVGVGSPLWQTLLAMGILGVGNGMFQSPNNSDIFGVVPPRQLGIAGGINALFRNVGFVAGTAFSVLIFSFTARMDVNALTSGMDGAAFLRGYRAVFVFCSVCALVSLGLCFTRVAGLALKLKKKEA